MRLSSTCVFLSRNNLTRQLYLNTEKLCAQKSTHPTRNSYKKTVVYDPSKSETYRALQDDNLVGEPYTYEAPAVQPVTPKVFHPQRGAPHPVKVLSLFALFCCYLLPFNTL